jgi:hypothetical protein
MFAKSQRNIHLNIKILIRSNSRRESYSPIEMSFKRFRRYQLVRGPKRIKGKMLRNKLKEYLP